jgi:Uma2 family endonuclease
MVATLTTTEQEPLVLHFGSVLQKLTEDDFYEFCRLNGEQPIELTSEGDLLIMSPTGGKTGIRNMELAIQLGSWTKQDGTGRGFDSSTLFTLPNRAKRSPDFAWVRKERWQTLTEEEQEKFPPLCPDFVVELRSPTDSLKRLQEKMEEYVANGAQLGWLLDPFERKVYVYRPQMAVEVLNEPQTISGEPLLHGFVLNPQEIWD